MTTKDSSKLKFKLEIACCADTVNNANPNQDFTLNINGNEYLANNKHLRTVSKTIASLPSDAKSYSIYFPLIDKGFISSFAMALSGMNMIEIDATQLKWFAEMWHDFQIDGELKFNTTDTIAQKLGNTLLNLLKPDCVIKIFEFASGMGLQNLKEGCFKLLYQLGYKPIKELERKIEIIDEEFEELMKIICQNVKKDSGMLLLTDTEVPQIIDVQFSTENEALAQLKKLRLREVCSRILEGDQKILDKANKSSLGYSELLAVIAQGEKQRKFDAKRIKLLEDQLEAERKRVTELEYLYGRLSQIEEALGNKYCSVYRFLRVRDSDWKNENKPDGITFTASRDITVFALGLYLPIEGEVRGKIKLCEGSDCSKEGLVTLDVVMGTEKGELLHPQVRKVEFPKVVKCVAGKEYTCVVQLLGGETWWGISGQQRVAGDKGVIFTFRNAKNSNATNSTSGQIPIIYYDL